MKVYSQRNEQLVGSITNCDLKDASVFTCDYDRNAYHMVFGYFFDYDNGWIKRHNAALCDTVSHFGKKSVRITGQNGIERTLKLHVGDGSTPREYLVSAWVKVVDGTFHIYGHYGHKHPDFDDEIPLAVTGPVQFFGGDSIRLSQTSGWQYIERRLRPGSEISQSDWDGGMQYAKVRMALLDSGEAFIDDIRIAPVDAFVTTNYYDERNRLFCTVDENNKAQYTEYDAWDRVAAVRNNAGDVVESYEYKLAGDLNEMQRYFNDYESGSHGFSASGNMNVGIDTGGYKSTNAVYGEVLTEGQIMWLALTSAEYKGKLCIVRGWYKADFTVRVTGDFVSGGGQNTVLTTNMAPSLEWRQFTVLLDYRNADPSATEIRLFFGDQPLDAPWPRTGNFIRLDNVTITAVDDVSS